MTRHLLYDNKLRFQWGNIFTVTNMADINGFNYVQMDLVRPDQVSILVEVTANLVIFQNNGQSPVQLRRRSDTATLRIPHFIPMVFGHQYSSPTGEIVKITFPCVNIKGQDVLATLTFNSVDRYRLEVSLQVP